MRLFRHSKVYFIHRVPWMLSSWFTLGYTATAATAVCRDFTVTSLEAAIFKLSFSNLVGMFMVTRACLGLFLGSFQKQDGRQGRFLCRKMPFFRQLVLLSCKFNLSIIVILDRYMHLLYTCEPSILRLFLEGCPGGVKVPHRGNYVIGCVSSLIIRTSENFSISEVT